MIATNMYAQCDPDGNQYGLLDSIINFRRSTTALCYAYQNTKKRGRTYYRRSTAGWQLCCQWKYGSTSWTKLSDLKESHPIETAEFAVYQGIDGGPSFNWWLPHVIKKRVHIISLLKKRSMCYLKKNHKFGFEVPKSTKHAFDIDSKNGNTFWSDDISKEMKNV